MFRASGARRICWLAIVAIFAATFAFIAMRYDSLPLTIPTHFDLAGNPNGYGPRGEVWAVALLLAAVSGVLYAVSRLPLRMLRPGLAVAPENEGRQRDAARDLLASLALGFALIDLAVTVMIVGSAANRFAASNFVIPAIVGMFVLVPLGVYASRTRSA